MFVVDDVKNCKSATSPDNAVDVILALPADVKAGIPNSIPETWFIALVSVSILKVVGLPPLICNF